MNPRTTRLLPLSLLLVTVRLQGCAAAVVGGAATGVAVVHDRRSAGMVLDDQSIELKGVELLAARPDIEGHSNIGVTSYNKSVLLTGQADTEEIRAQAAQVVGSIEGVRRVINEVQIGPDLSLNRKSEDSYITAKVKAALFNVKLAEFDPSRVKVVTHAGTVYLMGLVTAQEANAAVEQSRIVAGVQRVVRAFELITL